MSLYLERYAWPHNLFPGYQPDPDLEMVVVIPCYNEPNIEQALLSLNDCITPCRFLVLVIVNESEDEERGISQQNSETINTLSNLSLRYELQFTHLKLPSKKAGVGLARKIGMDQAIRYFEFINRDGIIICFDADCKCEMNYLQAIHDFYNSAQNECGIVFYEHDLSEHTEIITDYEIHLRYYIDALRWAGFPNAFQTLGSCITVKSERYQKEGGMNTRKAGEDFYFLHKVIPNGKFGEINGTTIFPSARISDRVPFGTGHAVAKNLDGNFQTYNPEIFEELQALPDQLNLIFEGSKVEFSQTLNRYFDEINFHESLERIRTEASNLIDFENRFFRWFDGFKILKAVHFIRDYNHPNCKIQKAISWMSEKELISHPTTKTGALLELRNLDRLDRQGN